MSYSLKDSGGKVRFLKDGELYWSLHDDIEICDDPKYTLWSEDGTRLAFCGWIVSYDEGETVYEQAEENDFPLTVVVDVASRRFLSVYRSHIQPLQWNDSCDDVVVTDDSILRKRLDAALWQDEYREPEKKEVINYETARIEMWAKVAPGITDIAALEDELAALDLPFFEAGGIKPCDETLFRMAADHYRKKMAGDANVPIGPQPKNAAATVEPQPNTPFDELAARWPDQPKRTESRPAGKKPDKSNNALIILGALLISIFWIWGSISLYSGGHDTIAKGGAYVGIGVLVAILSRLLVRYELRFDRKFLRWRLLAIFVASFSSLSYQTARGVNWLIVSIAGYQPGYFAIFWCEIIPLGIMLALGTAMSKNEPDESRAKLWAWLGTTTLILIIGAFVFAAMSAK